jgi:bacteriocin-like protein
MALRPEMEQIMSKTTVHDPEVDLEVHELTDDELDVVSGGSDHKAIEIKDYGFGVSMPVTTS